MEGSEPKKPMFGETYVFIPGCPPHPKGEPQPSRNGDSPEFFEENALCKEIVDAERQRAGRRCHVQMWVVTSPQTPNVSIGP